MSAFEPTSGKRDCMLALARQRWGELDLRLVSDPAALADLWHVMDWRDGSNVVSVLPCGPCVLLVQRMPGLWRWLAFAPPREAMVQVSFVSICAEGTRKMPAEYVTQWTMKDTLRTSVVPIKVGDRIAGVQRDTGYCYIGICTEMSEGRVSRVRLACHDEENSADDYAFRWFPITERDAAFDYAMLNREAPFGHYRAMQGYMYGKQRKLTGARPAPHVPDLTALPAWAGMPHISKRARELMEAPAAALPSVPVHINDPRITTEAQREAWRALDSETVSRMRAGAREFDVREWRDAERMKLIQS